MPTTTPPEEHESLISDFPFIAHDGAAKSRRQIPTFVRAHVMERYHRERRAKKGIKDSGNTVWSQHEFIMAAGPGQVLKWEDESTPCKTKARKKAASVESKINRKHQQNRDRRRGAIQQQMLLSHASLKWAKKPSILKR